MHIPKVSIVTPSFNQGQFIEETILSVLNQGYPNLEYIIIDGGSTDKSVEIIKKYQNRLAYWTSEPDKGQSDAINKGFKIATGEILAWLNSDDLYVPGAISIVSDFFEKHKEIDCVYGDMVAIDNTGKKLHTIKSIPYNYRVHLYGGCLVPQPACFFRKRALDLVGYLDVTLQYQMDFDLFLRFANNNVKFANIPQELACVRLHAKSKTVSQYEGKVKYESKITKNKYRHKLFAQDEALDDNWLLFLRWVCRFKTFILRAFTRGQFSLFRITIIRKSIFK